MKVTQVKKWLQIHQQPLDDKRVRMMMKVIHFSITKLQIQKKNQSQRPSNENLEARNPIAESTILT